MADIGTLALKITADGSALFSSLDKTERAIGRADRVAGSSTMADRFQAGLNTMQSSAASASDTIAGVFSGLAQGNLSGLERAFTAAKSAVAGLSAKIFERLKATFTAPVEVKVAADAKQADAAIARVRQAAGAAATSSGPAVAGTNSLTSSLAGLAGAIPGVSSLGSALAAALGPIGAIAAAAAAAISALTATLFSAVKAGFDNIRTQTRIGQLFGINRAEAAGLQAAMAQVGTTFDVVDGPLGRLQRNLGRLRTGISLGASGGNMEGVAQRFNVNARELSNIPLTSALGRIADAFNAIENASERAAFAEAMFGRQWESVVPLLRGGSEALTEATQRAERLGIAVSDSDARKITSANKTIRMLGADVSALWDSFSNRAAVQLAPVIERVASALHVVVDALGGAGPVMDFLIRTMVGPIELLVQAIGHGVRFMGAAGYAMTEMLVGLLRTADRVQQVVTAGISGGPESATSRLAGQIREANQRVFANYMRTADTLLNGPTGRRTTTPERPGTSAMDRADGESGRARSLLEANTEETQKFLSNLSNERGNNPVVEKIAESNRVLEEISEAVKAIVQNARELPGVKTVTDLLGF